VAARAADKQSAGNKADPRTGVMVIVDKIALQPEFHAPHRLSSALHGRGLRSALLAQIRAYKVFRTKKQQ
jgi:hypothetical protein